MIFSMDFLWSGTCTQRQGSGFAGALFVTFSMRLSAGPCSCVVAPHRLVRCCHVMWRAARPHGRFFVALHIRSTTSTNENLHSRATHTVRLMSALLRVPARRRRVWVLAVCHCYDRLFSENHEKFDVPCSHDGVLDALTQGSPLDSRSSRQLERLRPHQPALCRARCARRLRQRDRARPPPPRPQPAVLQARPRSSRSA